jgi:hypothetical protein
MKEEPLSVSTAWGKTTEVGTHRNIQNVTDQSSLEPGGRNRSFSFVLLFPSNLQITAGNNHSTYLQ